MPIVVGSAHFLVAIFFAVHCVRTHQNMYWLMILFAFPLLGSVVYFFGIYLPSSRIERQAKLAVSAAAKLLDPERELRAAEEAFDITATVKNRLRLADAQTERGLFEEAAKNYEACLDGPFSTDTLLRINVSRCLLEIDSPDRALEHLKTLQKQSPNYRSETFSLLLAKAYAATGDQRNARVEFENAFNHYGSFSVTAEYAIWALGKRDVDTASKLIEEIEKKTRHWDKGTRQLNAPLLQKLEAAFRLASQDNNS